MATTAERTRTSTLTDEMLALFGERAARYDAENRFFREDFEELRAAGYLMVLVPEELGGLGLTIAEATRSRINAFGIEYTGRSGLSTAEFSWAA